MSCERCEFFAECEGLGQELCVCADYDESDESDESRREEREAYEIDKADAKRKGEW